MIVTDEEARKLVCPMTMNNSGLVNPGHCKGTDCMAFTYADTRDGEDRYYCGMAACPSPRTNSGEAL